MYLGLYILFYAFQHVFLSYTQHKLEHIRSWILKFKPLPNVISTTKNRKSLKTLLWICNCDVKLVELYAHHQPRANLSFPRSSPATPRRPRARLGQHLVRRGARSALRGGFGHRWAPGAVATDSVQAQTLYPSPRRPPDSTPPVRRRRPQGPQAAGLPSRTLKTLPKDRIWALAPGEPLLP